MLDGLLQQALLAWGDGDEAVLTGLGDQVHRLLSLFLAPAPTRR